ncbi:hypothetical protein, partial [Veillonella sp. ZSJB6]|uniref:hypothetical protein n=1 Tax=Veillonella sp. ZSJB6 TaxID=3451359 RepID=UPI003F6593CF
TLVGCDWYVIELTVCGAQCVTSQTRLMVKFTQALCFWLTKIIRRDYLRVFGKIDEIIEVFIILINHPIAVGIGLG